MNNRYDIIIIGSGIGGLTAAGLLSQDKKVLVLEKNRTFGGYCSSFHRGGFKFESAIQAINGLYKNNPVYEALKKSEGVDIVETVMPNNLYRTIFPRHDITVPQRNLEKYIKILISYFPKEEKGIISLFSTMSLIFKEMYRFHVDKSLKRSPNILKYNKRSLKQLLDEFISNSELKAIISQYWMYRGLPPSKFPAITFAFIWHDYTANGSYFPNRGMGEILKGIVENIRENGGDVISNEEAVKLYMRRGRIDHVILRNGRKIRADTYISNIDVFRTFEMIKSKDNYEIKSFLAKLKRRSASISAFKIYLGLSIDVKTAGIPEYEIFVNSSYDIEKMYNASLENDFKKAAYSITIYSNLTDSFCTKGHSVISIGVLAGYEYWRNLSPAEYKKRKAEASESIIERAEKVIPNLREYIKTKVVATPLTMERYTGNSKGSIYGWNKKSPSIHELAYINPTTPIKNLMLASHWTKLGGGVGGAVLSADRVSNLIK